MKQLLLLISLIILIGCGTESPPDLSENSDTDRDDDNQYKTYYKSLNGKKIDGNVDDHILECVDYGGIVECKSICIAEAFPGYKRYDLFMTYYLTGDKCEFYIFSSPTETEMSTYELYRGDYYNQHCVNYSKIDEGYTSFSSKFDYMYTYDYDNNLKETIPISSTGLLKIENLENHHEYEIQENCIKKEDITDELIQGVRI